ncbi:MAG: hypothetical protein KAT65_02220, partial [Methanophagales archaeon]|nr:hypothetical protein [Methanophagales archaeon]
EMRNVVVTGVETPLASRQAYWYSRVSGYLLADERSGTLTIYDIPENVRLILNEINITCEKSLISLVDFGIAAIGEEPYWRRRR